MCKTKCLASSAVTPRVRTLPAVSQTCAAGGDRTSVHPLDVSLEPVLLRSPFSVPDSASADRTLEIFI